jgi:hypothetical protein
MEVATAQREVRQVFRGGSVGQLVSGLVWLASAVVATYGTPKSAATVLIVGGFVIFPLTMLGLRLLGGPAKLGPDNPLNGLGMQVAFVLPLIIPIVIALAVHHVEWFYPAMMVAVGAHYLPFIFLYGMPIYGVLCGVLVAGGVTIAHRPHTEFSTGAWVTAVILFGFSVVAWYLTRDERGRNP